IVEAEDLDRKTFRVAADGLLARAMQHEIEHLEGRVFLMNLSPLKRELIKRQIKKRMKAGGWRMAFEGAALAWRPASSGIRVRRARRSHLSTGAAARGRMPRW